MSISGFASSGRHHHEAARNTGVYNQGFKSVLSAGAAEFEEDASVEPQLVNAVGANYNWTQLKYLKKRTKRNIMGNTTIFNGKLLRRHC